MSTDQERFDDEKTRQGLPGINLKRPPHEPVKGGPVDLSPDDEVIELVDVVMKGERPPNVETDDLALLLDKEKNAKEETVFEEKAEEDSSELSRALAKETAENGADIFDSLDFDFKTPEDLEKPTQYTVSELPQDDLTEVMASLEDAGETDESGSTVISGKLPTISTARLENIITEAVKDVVERVTRETMSEVAEKVIKEAIDGLKQSLEPPPA